MSWLHDFMEATKEAESPRSYFWWAGLATISAVVNNKVWLNKHLYKLNPNLFVLLIGKSGLRKSAPVAIARMMVERTKITKVIYGRASIQAIIKELGQAYTLESGKVLSEATAFLCSSEFSASLVRDEDALTILTDLHDGHYHEDGWRNTLKSTGVDKLEAPNLTILSATNQTHFDDVVSSVSMMGGFIARTILVVENQKSRVNDLLDPPEIPFVINDFVPYLTELSKLRGEFKLEPEAKGLFREWYKEFNSGEIEDKTGTSERLHDRILKVAMNIALSERPKLVIDEGHMKQAMDVCIHGISLANKATMSQGKSDMAPKTSIFLQRLVNSPGYEIDRKTLLSREWGNFDSVDIDRIAETLIQAGAIKAENRGGKVFYALTEESIKWMSSKT